MASCGSLQQIFEGPLPKNPTLIESLSWNQIKPMRKPTEISSFSEMIGELNFEDNSSPPPPPPSTLFPSPPPSSSASCNKNLNPIFDQLNNEQLEEKNNLLPSCSFLGGGANKNREYMDNGGSKISSAGGYQSKKNLQMCTEGLGVESFDCIEEEKKDDSENQEKNRSKLGHHISSSSSHIMGHEFRRLSRTGARKFPPPISSIGISGKPGVSFRSFRKDGRFVLKEIRIPTQEFLHASREDGRLKLNFVHPQRRILEEQKEEDTESSCIDDEHEETKDVTDE
ncbi:hypothetical protein C5167_028788 [Papaver somniferum]|uniref:uncharacterized protein LOC113338767 n=1 Tax=Papaver somniferum TaxID=3469 RepID=UPI000E6FC8AF|nr:uncharacterized protein LOC113338767 [Papaver somniferum]RZC90956.1 hypothetical protein C5167_028788 [Papaver somniferum]